VRAMKAVARGLGGLVTWSVALVVGSALLLLSAVTRWGQLRWRR
jgi:hypothetical protein